MGLEDLIKKALGIQESPQVSRPIPVGKGVLEQIQARVEYSKLTPEAFQKFLDDSANRFEQGADHDIDKPSAPNLTLSNMPLQGGTSRTFYSVSRVDCDGDVEECEIEFSIEDHFTPRSIIQDCDGGDIEVGTKLESNECTDCSYTAIANRIGHINTPDWQGEVFYSDVLGRWFFADEFCKTDW